MPLVVNGTGAERQRIMGWLRQICGRLSVDRDTGDTDLSTPSPGGYRSGCDCLEAIINSHRTVTIQPWPGPDAPLPDGGTLEGLGGCATDIPPGGSITPAGPGIGPDGMPGGNTTVYIDITNNNGHGYDHGYPIWFVLAHELTTGHAFHLINGTDGPSAAEAEHQAITSEHAHALEHPRLPLRDPNDPSKILPFPE